MKDTVETVEIQKTVDRMIKFIEQNTSFCCTYFDYVGVYIVGEKWVWLDKGAKVVILKVYERNHEYLALNELGGQLRLKYLDKDSNVPLLIPENLKFYLGGIDD